MIEILIINSQIINSIKIGAKYNFDGFKVTFIDPHPNQFLEKSDIIRLAKSNPKIKGIIIGDEIFDNEVIDSFESLKIISKWGQGTDNIDLDYAKSLNIDVINTPGILAESVAEMAIGYMLSITKKIVFTHEDVKNNKWPKTKSFLISGKTISIIGLGNIGRYIAKLLNSFNVKIKGFDPYLLNNYEYEGLNIQFCDTLQDSLEDTNIVFLCCNLTHDNFKFMNKNIFSRLNQVNLINVGRGNLINEDDLLDAMINGQIAACALDVYSSEPLPHNSKLRNSNKIVFGTHSAGQTYEAIEKVNQLAIENLYPLKEDSL